MFPPGKKARTFDLDAIFEQTRRTAIERSQRVLGRFTNTISCLVAILSPGGCLCSNCTVIVAFPEERQKDSQMEEEGESSKSVKSSVHTQRDKAAAATSR